MTFSEEQKKKNLLKWNMTQYDMLERFVKNKHMISKLDINKISEKFAVLCDKLEEYPSFEEFLKFLNSSGLVNNYQMASRNRFEGVFPESYGNNYFKAGPTGTKGIKAKHPGITELPDGAWTDWSVDKLANHFAKLALLKGRGAMSKAIMNIERWNSVKHPTISKKARAVFNKYDSLLEKKGK